MHMSLREAMSIAILIPMLVPVRLGNVSSGYLRYLTGVLSK